MVWSINVFVSFCLFDCLFITHFLCFYVAVCCFSGVFRLCTIIAYNADLFLLDSFVISFDHHYLYNHFFTFPNQSDAEMHLLPHVYARGIIKQHLLGFTSLYGHLMWMTAFTLHRLSQFYLQNMCNLHTKRFNIDLYGSIVLPSMHALRYAAALVIVILILLAKIGRAMPGLSLPQVFG